MRHTKSYQPQNLNKHSSESQWCWQNVFITFQDINQNLNETTNVVHITRNDHLILISHQTNSCRGLERKVCTQHPSRTSPARHRFIKYPVSQLDELLLDKHVIRLRLDTIDLHDDCFLLLCSNRSNKKARTYLFIEISVVLHVFLEQLKALHKEWLCYYISIAKHML